MISTLRKCGLVAYRINHSKVSYLLYSHAIMFIFLDFKGESSITKKNLGVSHSPGKSDKVLKRQIYVRNSKKSYEGLKVKHKHHYGGAHYNSKSDERQAPELPSTTQKRVVSSSIAVKKDEHFDMIINEVESRHEKDYSQEGLRKSQSLVTEKFYPNDKKREVEHEGMLCNLIHRRKFIFRR